jgi:hypothetical protein
LPSLAPTAYIQPTAEAEKVKNVQTSALSGKSAGPVAGVVHIANTTAAATPSGTAGRAQWRTRPYPAAKLKIIRGLL